MRVINTIQDMKLTRGQMDGPLGFVPTMGYLHEGHLELVRNSRKENRFTIVSIFVNPTQFGPKEDFASYPRDPGRDCAMLEKAGVDIVFMPAPEEIYPPGFNTWVTLTGVTERLEGAIRPGHFRGVATVCNKLFNIVEAQTAYFGQKDAQQVVVIKKMVKDLAMNLRIVVVPTVREPDGLAMSSRNVYLNREQRKAAVVLWQSLSLARELCTGGETKAETIRHAMAGMLQRQTLAGPIDYVSIADAETLEELVNIDRPAVVSLAVRFGPTRLIDNITLPPP